MKTYEEMDDLDRDLLFEYKMESITKNKDSIQSNMKQYLLNLPQYIWNRWNNDTSQETQQVESNLIIFNNEIPQAHIIKFVKGILFIWMLQQSFFFILASNIDIPINFIFNSNDCILRFPVWIILLFHFSLSVFISFNYKQKQYMLNNQYPLLTTILILFQQANWSLIGGCFVTIGLSSDIAFCHKSKKFFYGLILFMASNFINCLLFIYCMWNFSIRKRSILIRYLIFPTILAVFFQRNNYLFYLLIEILSVCYQISFIFAIVKVAQEYKRLDIKPSLVGYIDAYAMSLKNWI